MSDTLVICLLIAWLVGPVLLVCALCWLSSREEDQRVADEVAELERLYDMATPTRGRNP
jgi:hypothetical protein